MFLIFSEVNELIWMKWSSGGELSRLTAPHQKKSLFCSYLLVRLQQKVHYDLKETPLLPTQELLEQKNKKLNKKRHLMRCRWWRWWCWIYVFLQELIQAEDRPPADSWVHADEFVQVHLALWGGITSQDDIIVLYVFSIKQANLTFGLYGGVRRRGHLPASIGVLHVRPIRRKVQQETVCGNHTQLPVTDTHKL